MNWKKRKKELDKKYDYFWNHIGIDGIDTEEKKGEKRIEVNKENSEKNKKNEC